VHEAPVELDELCEVLERISGEWSKPIAQGESWDRPAKPFHVLFHSTVEDHERLPTRIAAIPHVMEFATSPRI
jgi:hypothetical protein